MRRLFALGLVLSAALIVPPAAVAFTPQEAILRAKPAAALIEARVEAEVTMNCGQGPVIVRPAPFIETGTGWFVDGRGYVITNAHVVDPVHRMPPWVAHELGTPLSATRACRPSSSRICSTSRASSPARCGSTRARSPRPR